MSAPESPETNLPHSYDMNKRRRRTSSGDLSSEEAKNDIRPFKIQKTILSQAAGQQKNLSGRQIVPLRNRRPLIPSLSAREGHFDSGPAIPEETTQLSGFTTGTATVAEDSSDGELDEVFYETESFSDMDTGTTQLSGAEDVVMMRNQVAQLSLDNRLLCTKNALLRQDVKNLSIRIGHTMQTLQLLQEYAQGLGASELGASGTLDLEEASHM